MRPDAGKRSRKGECDCDLMSIHARRGSVDVVEEVQIWSWAKWSEVEENEGMEVPRNGTKAHRRLALANSIHPCSP